MRCFKMRLLDGGYLRQPALLDPRAQLRHERDEEGQRCKDHGAARPHGLDGDDTEQDADGHAEAQDFLFSITHHDSIHILFLKYSTAAAFRQGER